MSRGQCIKTKPTSGDKKLIKFQMTIALDAGIGRSPFEVIGDVGIDDVPLKFFREVEHVMINAKRRCDERCVSYVFNGTTP